MAIEAAGGWEWRSAAGPRPAGSRDRGALAGLRRRARARSWSSRRRRGCRASRRRARPGRRLDLRHRARSCARSSTPGSGGSTWASAAAPRPTAASGSSPPWGSGMTVEPELVVHLDELDPRLAEVDLRIASDVTNPLLGPGRGRRRLRPAEGRQRRSTSATSTTPSAAGPTRWRRRPAAASATRPARARPAARSSGSPASATASARSRSCRGSTSSWRRRASPRSSPAPTSSSPARAGSTARPRSARPPSGSPGGPRAAGVPCVAVGGGVEPEGIAALAAVGAVAVPVVERPQSVEEAMAAGAGAPGALRRAPGAPGRAPGRLDSHPRVTAPDTTLRRSATPLPR